MSETRPVTRSPILLVLALTAIATLAAWSLDRVARSAPGRSSPAPSRPAIVSLAPAITETLFAIGAGSQVVAMSDYCDHPAEAAQLPRVGTGLTPNYERIAALSPTLILTDRHTGTKRQQLAALGPVRAMAWLTLRDVARSIRELGVLTHHEDAANRLAARMRTRLAVSPPADAPRVLLTYTTAALGLGQVWFIQRNSLHGAALRAAGGRNAVARDVHGIPRMSLEQVVQIDPDMIIVLAVDGRSQEPAKQKLVTEWQALGSLRAVRDQRIAVVQGASVHAMGPRILELVERLARAIDSMRTAT